MQTSLSEESPPVDLPGGGESWAAGKEGVVEVGEASDMEEAFVTVGCPWVVSALVPPWDTVISGPAGW